MSWWRPKPAAPVGPVEALSALTAALRAAGVSHYDGPVPNWDSERTVKLILGAPLALPVGEPRPAPARRPLTKPSLDEVEAAVLGHLRVHGGGQ